MRWWIHLLARPNPSLFLNSLSVSGVYCTAELCVKAGFLYPLSIQVEWFTANTKDIQFMWFLFTLKYNTNWFFYSNPCLTENSTVHSILKCRILKLQFDLTLHQSKQNNDCKMNCHQTVELQCIIYVYVGIRHFCCWLCAYTYTVRQKKCSILTSTLLAVYWYFMRLLILSFTDTYVYWFLCLLIIHMFTDT